MTIDPKTRLRRCLLLLRADRRGIRRLDRSRRVHLTCSGLSAATTAQASAVVVCLQHEAEQRLHDRREIEEAGRVQRALLANRGS